MPHWKSGKFHREQVPWAIRRFAPTSSLHSLEEVDLNGLAHGGKTLILLDVDNTLLPWRSSDIPESTFAWIKRARDLGFRMCILSNTKNPTRLQKLSETLEIPFIRDRFKPSRRMYHLALKQFGVPAKEAVMIGDQLLTDVWGANRAGIDALWVRPSSNLDFIGTKLISRRIERFLGRMLYKYFQTDGALGETRPGFFRSNVFRQLLKFAVVGAVATSVDLGLHRWLLFHAEWGGAPLHVVVGEWMIQTFGFDQPAGGDLKKTAFGPLKVVPVLLAIFVSYMLNRWYTFKAGDEKIKARQVAQFYIVALIGMVISVSVSTLMNSILRGDPNADWFLASLCGMVAGFFWNFNGQRLWTFRSSK